MITTEGSIEVTTYAPPLEPMVYMDMQPVFPKKKVMKAFPMFITIFCHEYCDAANLVNSILQVSDYEMISAVTMENAGDWEYLIDGDLYLIRWRRPTVMTIRNLQGDIAYVKHNILNADIIDQIRLNHPKGVYFF